MNVKPGLNEYQIEALFLEYVSSQNADSLAYGSICGSGKDCGVLHYIQNDKEL